MLPEQAIIAKRLTKRFFKQGQRTLKELLHAVFLRKESPGEFVLALNQVTFTINKGESVGIIGVNGAGKSTLLKLMAGVTKPTSGSITVNGRLAPLIELGAGFHPELTGRENIVLNATILGMKKSEITSRIPDIIEFSELAEFIDTPVKYYSSGMYLRLAFSVAIHVEADTVLIDEILAVGDEKFQKKCLARLNQMKKDGKTIILVSHNMHATLDFCERVIYLESGKVKMDSTAHASISLYSKDMEQGS